MVYAQKVSIKEINECRTTSDESYNKKCEIKLKVSGDETRKFKFAKISNISKAIDDRGIDLIDEDKIENKYIEISEYAVLTFETKIPSRKADVIKEIAGEISLYNPTEQNGGIIKIPNYQNKTNVNLLPNNSQVQLLYLTKESIEKYVKENKAKKEEELKKMPEIARKMVEGLISGFEELFGEKRDDQNQAFFYINGDDSKVVDIYFEDINGKIVNYNGKSTSNGLISYYLSEKPNPNWKLILKVESVNSTKKVPFKIVNIELP